MYILQFSTYFFGTKAVENKKKERDNNKKKSRQQKETHEKNFMNLNRNNKNNRH